MNKTEILSNKERLSEDWEAVATDCRATVGKDALGHAPTSAFKQRILLAEHSPIRDLAIRWKWADIPSWVATHWSRHKFEKFIKTQRTDRTGVDRTELPQDAPVTFTGNANAQNLIDAWRKRLCFQASKETRAYAVDFKKALHEIEPELADVLVCNCVYRGFCPEMATCGFWNTFIKDMTKEDIVDWQVRYGRYNADFYGGDESHE